MNDATRPASAPVTGAADAAVAGTDEPTKASSALDIGSQHRMGGVARHWIPAVALLAVVASLSLADDDSQTASLAIGGALVVLLVVLVSAKNISDHVAALAFFVVGAGVFGVPPDVVFAGFESPASWLILAGMVIGAALNDTGLTARIADRILGLIGARYGTVIGAIAVLALILVVLVPSTTARVLLLVPITTALADRLGYAPSSRGFAGMVIAVSVMSYLPCTGIMTSNIRNLGVVGAAQSLYGITFSYTDFLVWNFPLLSLSLTGVFWLVVVCRYAEPADPKGRAAIREPLGTRERQVLAMAFCTIALWMTDFVHGMSPAWIGLGAAIFCLHGPCRSMAFSERVKLGSWLVYVAFIGLAAVLGHTGLGPWLGATLVDAADLRPDTPVWNFGAVTAIGIVVGIVTTNLAGPVVLAALAEPISQAAGWSVQGTLVAMMPSWSVFLFAYQAPVILVAMRMANIPLRELSACLLILGASALTVIVPLQFLWLSLLGVFR